MNDLWLASYVAMWLLILLLTVLMLGLLRQVGLLNQRLFTAHRAVTAGLEPGTPAPVFSASSLDGGEVSLRNLFDRGKAVLLVFASPRCTPCVRMAPVLDAFYLRSRGGGWAVLMVSMGAGRAGAEAYVQETGVHFPVIVQEKSEISLPYKFAGSPFAFVLGGGIVKARRKIDDKQQFEALLREGGVTPVPDSATPGAADEQTLQVAR